MNNITFKRKGRKSMLGTRQFKPPPIETITEKSPMEENELPQPPKPVITKEPVKESVTVKQVKEVVIEKQVEKVLIEKQVEDVVIDEPEPVEEDGLIIKTTTRKTLVCTLFPADDSFEANETMLANTSFNETVLATTLLGSAKKSEDSVLAERNKELTPPKKKEDETLQQILDTVTLLLKKNEDAMENNRKEREILLETKKRLMDKIQQ
ncbi:uncharacterized protein LOC135840721 [Planococcus citri]|uniref:uncharacterized protein LOC135840721 n=1 Tax=Planococcus citri TaxID=170843 RepID=UPI0031F7A136